MIWTATEVYDGVAARYENEAVLISEVANGAGFSARRHMDALAIGLWPSRGLYLHAIEIKVSRSDFRREIANPSKADDIAKYCDHMWIAAPKDVVPLDELPGNWGLYEVELKGKKLKAVIKRRAKPIDAKPLDRGFVVSIARRLVEQHSAAHILEGLTATARGEGYREGRAGAAEDLVRLRTDLAHTRSEHAGLRNALRGADAFQVGRIHQILRSLGGEMGSLNVLRVRAREIAKQADDLETITKALIKQGE